MSLVHAFLVRADRGDFFSIREAESFLEAATALLASRWGAYGDALRAPHLLKSKAAKRAYEEAQRVHDVAHRVLAAAKAKRCGRCKNWARRLHHFGCAAFKTGFRVETRWMFAKDGPPWNDCRHFEPTAEALGSNQDG
jgi:hypothetical protein